MKNKKILSAAALLITTFGPLMACSTVSIRVPVTRPAEISLRGKSELVIGEMSGYKAASIESRLKSAIADSGKFKLLERNNLNKVMTELRLSASDLSDPSSQRKLGKLMTAAIMLIGKMEHADYTEQQNNLRTTCSRTVGSGKNRRTESYACTKYTRDGKARVAVGFDIIDVESGQNLKPKRVSCEKTRHTETTESRNPPSIDGNAMLETCYTEVVTNFMKSIAPWTDYVTANFKKTSDLPMLEMGINFAKRGEWEDAIAKFKSALELANKTPDMDAESIAYAHWDLGLAYEYTNKFDEAITAVKKAYEMTQDESFLSELDNIKKLRADAKKLKEQNAPLDDSNA